MDSLIVFSLVLWLSLCAASGRLCYRAVRYRETGTAREWALVVALCLGTLISLHKAIERLFNL